MGRHDTSSDYGPSYGIGKFGNSCWYFPNSAPYMLSIAYHPDFSFGTGDFTIDWWENRVAATGGTLSQYASSGLRPYIVGSAESSVNKVYLTSDGATWDIADAQSMGSITLGIWTHFALVRSGNTFYTFKNGVQISTWSSALALFDYSQPLYVAGYNTYYGYIDEFRISRVARWTSAFTVATEPYAADPYTVYLSHCEGDASSRKINPVFATYCAQMKRSALAPNDYYGGSYNAYRDPVSTGMRADQFTQTTDEFTFGTGDFTIDMWLYRPVLGWSAIIGDVGGNSNDGPTGMLMYIDSSGGGPGGRGINLQRDWWTPLAGCSCDLPTDGWHHVACTRVGNTFSMYLDGVLGGTGTYSGAMNMRYGAFVMGHPWLAYTYAWGVNFYITGFRISKGIARWLGNFTPPGRPHYMPIGGVDGYTKFMLHFDSEQSSTYFLDATAKPKTVSSAGVTQLTTQRVFGKSCGYFGGSNYLSTTYHSDFNFGTEDFTIDFRVKRTTAAADILYYQGELTGDGTPFIKISIDENGDDKLLFKDTAAGVTLYSTGTIDTNWHHVAVVRSGGVLSLYIDGAGSGSTAYATSSTLTNKPIYLGKGITPGSIEGFFTGYLDEFRVSKGIARWAGAFTQPDRAYSRSSVDSYTALLLHLDGDSVSPVYTDVGVKGNIVSNYGVTADGPQAVYGGKSGIFDGSSYMLVADSSNFEFGTGDFEVDLWVRPDDLAGNRTIFSQISGAAEGIVFAMATGVINIYATVGATKYGSYNSGTMLPNVTWSHLALVKRGITVTAYLNGVALPAGDASTSVTTVTLFNHPAAPLCIGRNNNSGAAYFSGNMQEIRVSKGVSRWSTNFTTAVRPYGSA